jgi:hypothetical protein
MVRNPTNSTPTSSGVLLLLSSDGFGDNLYTRRIQLLWSLDQTFFFFFRWASCLRAKVRRRSLVTVTSLCGVLVLLGEHRSHHSKRKVPYIFAFRPTSTKNTFQLRTDVAQVETGCTLIGSSTGYAESFQRIVPDLFVHFSRALRPLSHVPSSIPLPLSMLQR